MSNRNFDFSSIVKILKAQNAANFYNRQQQIVSTISGIPAQIEIQPANPLTVNYDADTIPDIRAGQQAYYFKNYPITTVLSPQSYTPTSDPIPPTIPPTVPSAPVITSVVPGNEELFVYFTQASSGSSSITNYLYSLDTGSTFAPFVPPQTTSPLVISGLTNGTVYDVVIQAVSSVGISASSNDISGTPSNVLTNPPVLTYSVPADNSAYIYFTQDTSGGSPVSSYQYSTDGGTTYQNVASTGTTSPVYITGLTNGTTSSITLRSVSAIGPSATGSNTLSVTPVAPVVVASYLEYDPDNASSYSGSGPVNNVGSYGALSGTTSGTTYITGTGITRKVLNFGGSANIAFGAFNFTSTFTVCAWVYPIFKQSINSLISNGPSYTGTGPPGFKLNWNDYWDNSYPPGSDRANGTMVFETGNSAGSNWTIRGTPPNAVTRNVWQHLTYIFDNPTNVGVCFVNGQPVASGLADIAANTDVNRSAFRIGSYTPSGQNMNAQFGYLKIFNSVLNAGQILADYDNSKASFGLT